MNPNKIEAGCIAIFENIFEDPKKIIDYIEENSASNSSNNDWSWNKAGIISNDLNQKNRTNSFLPITKNAKNNDFMMKKLHNQIYYKIEESLKWYKEQYNITDDLYHEPYVILKYDNKEEYKNHFDGTTQTARCVSVVIYLNDDYTGGEIEFSNFGLKIKPKANSMILFPSNYAYIHQAHPINSGIKYAIVTWLHDWISPNVPQFPVKKSLKNIGIVGPIE